MDEYYFQWSCRLNFIRYGGIMGLFVVLNETVIWGTYLKMKYGNDFYFVLDVVAEDKIIL